MPKKGRSEDGELDFDEDNKKAGIVAGFVFVMTNNKQKKTPPKRGC
jgi:hypothetical protein